MYSECRASANVKNLTAPWAEVHSQAPHGGGSRSYSRQKSKVKQVKSSSLRIASPLTVSGDEVMGWRYLEGWMDRSDAIPYALVSTVK